MAKASKPKVEETSNNDPKIDEVAAIQPFSPEEEKTENPKEEPVAPIAVEIKKTDPVPFVPAHQPMIHMDKSKSHSERIIDFLKGKQGVIRLNDFLKSLFPLPIGGVPPEWTRQPAMKKLRHDLAKLNQESLIKFVNLNYERLGKHHFPDQTTGKTHYWDLSNTVIEVEVS